jgi:hypothetical protein
MIEYFEVPDENACTTSLDELDSCAMFNFNHHLKSAYIINHFLDASLVHGPCIKSFRRGLTMNLQPSSLNV